MIISLKLLILFVKTRSKHDRFEPQERRSFISSRPINKVASLPRRLREYRSMIAEVISRLVKFASEHIAISSGFDVALQSKVGLEYAGDHKAIK